MKNKILLLFIFLLSFFLTCSTKTEKIQMDSDNESDIDIIQIDNPGNVATGTLELVLSEDPDKDFADLLQTKSVLPEIDMTRDAFKIIATCSDGSAFRLTTRLTSIQILKMPVGRWRIQVESLNVDKFSIGYGQGSVDIAEYATSELSINVTPYAGFGTIEITVDWEAGTVNPILKGTLSSSSGPSYDLEFTIEGNTARASVTGAAGYYLLSLNLYDDEGVMYTYVGGAVEIIRIVEDETTPGVFTILSNTSYGYGDIVIGIIVDMKDPISIELSGQSASLYDNQPMTVQASSPGETENIEYTWYLNGELVGTGETYTTAANLYAGSYRLDVIAFNDSGDRGGSVSYMFEVLIAPPANLTYSTNPAVYTACIQIQDNIPSVTGAGITYSIIPALPYGLTLNTSTGVISGTPVNAMTETAYTIYATNSSGSTNVSLSITINEVLPVLSVTSIESDHVDFSWTYSFPNISGYEIYRSTTSGSYDYNNPLAVISTTLSSGSYTDNAVESGTTYYYIVRGYYGSLYSGSSNQVTAAVSGVINVYSCIYPSGYTLTSDEQAKYGTHTYNTLRAWHTARARNLVTADENEICEIINGNGWASPDILGVDINGSFVTDTDHRIIIHTTPGARHNGVWDNSKYRLSVSGDDSLYITEDYVRIEGLQISNEATASSHIGIQVQNQTANNQIEICYNIIKGSQTTAYSSHSGIYFGTNMINGKIWNNIVYGFNSSTSVNHGIWIYYFNQVYIYNNTVVNCLRGIITNYNATTGICLAINNLSSDNLLSDYYNTDYYSSNSDYNASSDSTSPLGSTGSHDRINQTFTFVDAANEDYRLSISDAGVRDFGYDLSSDPNIMIFDDIAGNLRTGSWDIGASEAQ